MAATTTVGVRLLRGVAAVVLGVLGLLAVLLVLLGIFARPGPDGVSRVAGHPILTVLSGSMRPVFQPGDLIVDNPVTLSQAQRLAAGNVITFHINDTPASNMITHRIIAVNHAPDGQVSFQTKGDANNVADNQPVTPQQVVGVYSQRVPFGGYLLQAAQNKTIFVIIIAIPLIYLIVAGIAKYWNEPTKDDAAAEGDSGPEGVESVDAVPAADDDTPEDPDSSAPAGSRNGLQLTPSRDGSEDEGGEAKG